MEEVRILYVNENLKSSGNYLNYLHIYGVRIVDNYINVCVYSDCKVLEMYINGKLCNRQKNHEIFDFYEPCNVNGNAEIKISDKNEPSISQVVNVVI